MLYFADIYRDYDICLTDESVSLVHPFAFESNDFTLSFWAVFDSPQTVNVEKDVFLQLKKAGYVFLYYFH